MQPKIYNAGWQALSDHGTIERNMPKNSHELPATSGAEVANPMALTVAQLARLLGMTEQKVYGHVADGAPISADGTINLVHYTAWLNVRLKERNGD